MLQGTQALQTNSCHSSCNM